MKTLTLHVKKVYFDEIASGVKLDEYREITPYWKNRLLNNEYDAVEICSGYPKKDDTERRLRFEWDGYKLKTIRHKHFGEGKVNVFAISLRGERR